MDITYGYISPNETMIAIEPSFDYGIIILAMQRNKLRHLVTFHNQEFGHGTEIVRMPDNTFLFTIDDGIYRTNSSFGQAQLVKSINLQDRGEPSTHTSVI